MLRAAGDPARLRVLEMLSGGELCVTEIAERSGGNMPAVSQRLRVLRGEGLVSSRREGKHVFYALADDHVAELILNVLHHAGEPQR
jgi:ArsR family transcriptional regulator